MEKQNKLNFLRATSDNLPSLTFEMIMDYLSGSKDYFSAETRGSKAARSARSDYGDKAISYVELCRQQSICITRAKITPEHRLRAKPYSVTVAIDECHQSSVQSAQCGGCVASEGGCKHAIAFLFWLHRRSEEPSPISTFSYWKKGVLASVGDAKVFVLDGMRSKPIDTPPLQDNFFQETVEFLNKHNTNSMLLTLKSESEFNNMSMHHLMHKYKKLNRPIGDALNFFRFCCDSFNEQMCKRVEQKTQGQSSNSLWFEMRYGRVTASNIYPCARCKTKEGSLVERILEAGQVIDTRAMQRGRNLESGVIAEVRHLLGEKLNKWGILINPKIPFLGASPDALGKDFVVEVKCPLKDTAKYLPSTGTVPEPFAAQLQIQMHLHNVKKGLFVVADPKFETSKKV